MEKLTIGAVIGEKEIVGLIFECGDIYYLKVGFGRKPEIEPGAREVEGFKGDDCDEVIEGTQKRVDALNSNSAAFQARRLELRKETAVVHKKSARPPERHIRQRIRRMSEDSRIFDLFY